MRIGYTIAAGMLFLVVYLVVWPMLTTEHDAARHTRCLNNLKQIGLALQMYRQDFGGYWPPTSEGSDWTTLLEPYMKNTKILVCPQAPDEPCGYAFNRRLGELKEDQVKSPADIATAFDAKPGLGGRFGGHELVDYRHNGGANFLFADGHTVGEARIGSHCWDPTGRRSPSITH